MNIVLEGIYNKVIEQTGGAHNDFYDSIGGRFYHYYAPQDVTFPFCVAYLFNQKPDYQFTELYEECLIQFNLFSETSSSDEVGNVFVDLISLFDWCSTLSVTGYTVLKMEREFSNLTWDSEEEVWQYSVQYRLLMEKN